jgi:hypothetical protein
MRDGLTTGLIAYASVAAFYSAFDLLAARGTLYTVNLLGRTFFRGLRDPAVLQHPTHLDHGAIFWYNGLHLVASLVIGIVVVRLLEEAERRPSRAAGALTIIVAGFLVTVAAVGWLSTPIRVVLPWWSILVANSLAVILAGAFLLRRRPGLWSRVVASGFGRARRIPSVTGVLLVAGVLSAAACRGPSGDAAQEPAARGGAEADSTQSAAEKDHNACHLLGNDEVSDLAGIAVVMRDQTEAGDSYSICEYSDEAETFVFGLTVYWAGGKEQWDIWRAAAGMAGALTEQREGVTLEEVVEQGPVEGLGDAAFFSALLPSLVLKGDVLLEINMALIPEAGTKFRELAATLLGRI